MTINKRRLIPLLICLPFAHVAIADPSKQTTSNDEVLQTFQQGNAGGQQPQLVTQEDGSTRIEWHGGINTDFYNQQVNSGNGSTNTSLQSGSFYRGTLQSDLRAINQRGDATYFQFGLTQTDDRAVLSMHPRQINTLQFGRVGPGYQVTFGDIAPNFSPLSTALAARGLLAQIQHGQATITGYGGVIADSWEALNKLVPRNQFLRDTYGLKAEYALTSSLKIYLTGQTSKDRVGSTTFATSADPAKAQSGTLGFAYQDGPLQVTGETASSHYEQSNTESRTGKASIIDATWSGQEVSLRGGFHDVGTKYTNFISALATPGIEEIYASADWPAAAWISLGADLRNSKFRTLATSSSASTTSTARSGCSRSRASAPATCSTPTSSPASSSPASRRRTRSTP